MSLNVEHVVLTCSEFRRVDLDLPAGHRVLVLAGVKGDLGAFVGDAEVGVLDCVFCDADLPRRWNVDTNVGDPGTP
ncbi:hypothetical protein [Streptomyces katrae]|uniref:hypothetical protein n=1 Tax=Streptomyces katrae TaxID=68223 RepID=UPI000A91B2AB|nr:hypothetical protein [Streptomyces katrae]